MEEQEAVIAEVENTETVDVSAEGLNAPLEADSAVSEPVADVAE